MANGRCGEGSAGPRVRPEEYAAISEPDGRRSPYTHILIPTNLVLDDQAALQTGFELAVMNRAVVTVLHIVPSAEIRPTTNGLDAIGLLHPAADEFHAGPAVLRSALESARRQVGEFVQQVVPARLTDAVEVRAESRAGQVAERIARFADEADADLVIFPVRPPRWWRPLLPAVVRRVLELTRKPVVLAPRGAGKRRAIGA
jgi:nucleotide-binding universal stress UspA family protein